MNRQSLLQYPELAGMQKKVLYDRSRTMALKIEEYLKTKDTYFIIVGAAHTVGKDGIIAILKNRGLQVERL
jgi:uncharacterized protein YbaP (TraB family)